MIDTNSKLFKANPFLPFGFFIILMPLLQTINNLGKGEGTLLLNFFKIIPFVLIAIYFIIFSIRGLISLAKEKEDIAKPYKKIIAIISLILWVIVLIYLCFVIIVYLLFSGGSFFI